MKPPRPTKPLWLSLLGFSLLLNLALLTIVARRGDRQLDLMNRARVSEGGEDVDRARRKPDVTARIMTEGLPPGYRNILRGHPGSIASLRFSADHSRLCIMADGGSLTVWNLRSRKVEWEPPIPASAAGYLPILRTLSFSPGGDRLAYTVAERSSTPDLFTVLTRDLATGHENMWRYDQITTELGSSFAVETLPMGPWSRSWRLPSRADPARMSIRASSRMMAPGWRWLESRTKLGPYQSRTWG
jgi:hypothetical protein